MLAIPRALASGTREIGMGEGPKPVPLRHDMRRDALELYVVAKGSVLVDERHYAYAWNEGLT
jgi:hypothetical protein